MSRIYFSVLFITASLYQIKALSVLDWIWKKSDDTTVLIADGVPLISIPYEAMTEDEKFLQEAAKFTEIQTSSPLEICQHKVIMKIRTSCTDLSEEQLAKLSVNLLNCQSAVEGRKMFPCTEEMSLKQCTTDMDADMWNAYHIMSNRARAVCYAARSTQFRALTELTVNKLMQTAHSQIEKLSSLKESQDHLEEQIVGSLSSLSKSNNLLLEQQQHMKDIQAAAHNLVTTNLRELNNEKALIRSGHTLLAAMAEDIKTKLEKASEDIVQQAVERNDNHKEILEDLVNIQEQAQLIWEKIESSTNRIIAQHENAIDQYERTLQKLTQINETIHYLWSVTSTMRSEVDEKLGWITSYIGDTGEQLQKVYRTTMHIVYILVAMIVTAFLQAPFLTRATIMGIVPLNLVNYLRHGTEACLDFTSMTALIFLITGMYFVMIGIQYICGPKVKKLTSSESTNLTEQNTLSNGNAHKYTCSSHTNSVLKEPIYIRLGKKLKNIYTTICLPIQYCIDKTSSLIQSAASWSHQSLSIREELSCSYVASKKAREDLICDYETEFPSMSEDSVNMQSPDTTRVTRTRHDDSDNIVDINESSDRVLRTNTLTARNLYNRQSSRSVTPTYTAPRILCDAFTRSGRKCRLFAMHGRSFCSRHLNGSSIMGD